MTQFTILSGKAMIVELSEGAINPHIHPNSNGLWYKYEGGDKGGFSYKRCDLPPGNWRIIGMLSEVTEGQAAGIVDDVSFKYQYLFKRKFEDYSCEAENDHDTALESLESAILAEGWTFSNPYGMERPPNLPIDAIPYDQQPGYRAFRNTKPHLQPNDIELSYEFYCLAWQKAQSRVLSRERCLLLRRES